MHAKLSRNQYRIGSLIWATAFTAVVLRLAISLQSEFWFYLTPLIVAVLGAVVGRHLHRPVLGAVIAMSTLAIYVLTIPLLDDVASKGVWPFTTFKVYETYSFPFYLWGESVEWIWPYFHVWSTFCDMTPGLAAALLLISAIAVGYAATMVDRKHRRSDNGVKIPEVPT